MISRFLAFAFKSNLYRYAKLLELESTSAFGFNNRKEDSLRKLSNDCCHTARTSVAPSLGGGNFTACDVQAQCIKSDAGFELMAKTSDDLHQLKPQHKWLPWVLVEVGLYKSNPVRPKAWKAAWFQPLNL